MLSPHFPVSCLYERVISFAQKGMYFCSFASRSMRFQAANSARSSANGDSIGGGIFCSPSIIKLKVLLNGFLFEIIIVVLLQELLERQIFQNKKFI